MGLRAAGLPSLGFWIQDMRRGFEEKLGLLFRALTRAGVLI